MSFLVTGASGFVGRGLLPWLAARSRGGIATGRVLPTDLPAGWSGARRDDVLGEVADIGPVTTIVHLEVKQHVSRPTAEDEADFLRVNVEGTRAWLDWAGRRGVETFVFLSTIKAVASSDAPHAESSALDPNTPYGQSKAAAERAVEAWSRGNPARRGVILRPAPVYGPGNEANLAAFVRQVVAGRPCLLGTGATRKSIVSRTNLAAAIDFTASAARHGCEVFNVSDRETPTLRELATLVAMLAGAPAPRSFPLPLAMLAAPLGDFVTVLTGRDAPLTTNRLRALRETSIFPCDTLVARGFVHPQTTREGLAEMLSWLRRRL